MTRATQSRPSAQLERQLDAYAASARVNGSQRWTKYLLNGSAYAAAAGSALAFTTAADAGIIYSGPLNATLSLITFVGNSAVLKRSATRPITGLNAKMSLRFNSSRTSSGKFRRAGAASLLGNRNFQLLDSGFNLMKLQRSLDIPRGQCITSDFWPDPQAHQLPVLHEQDDKDKGLLCQKRDRICGLPVCRRHGRRRDSI